MKQRSGNGKFTIEIKDGYLEGSKYKRKDRTARIKLYAHEPTVRLEEVADAIIDCTFWGTRVNMCVDSNRFSKLNIDLIIQKSTNTVVTYNFNIFNYQSTGDVLPAIASNITL